MQKSDLNIYTDRLRISMVIMVHLLFIFGLAWIFFNSETHFLLKGLIVAVAILFGYITYLQMKNFAAKQLLYQISETGISDFTQTPMTLTIPWKKITRIEMFADSTDFKIIVTGATEELPVAYVVINRFSFRWSKFKQIWDKLTPYAEQYGIEIIDTRVINKS